MDNLLPRTQADTIPLKVLLTLRCRLGDSLMDNPHTCTWASCPDGTGLGLPYTYERMYTDTYTY